MKAPIIKKKHPDWYAIGGISLAAIIGLLYVILVRRFSNFPNGLFIVPITILTVGVGYGGVKYYIDNKQKQGDYSERYLDYQAEANELKQSLNKLKSQLIDFQRCVDDLEFYMVKDEDIYFAKECYEYLIPFDAKKKKINIDERLLDELLRNAPLSVIIYKYYRNELAQYSMISSYDKYREAQSLDLKGAIELVKGRAEEDALRLEANQSTDEVLESREQNKLEQVPYQRIRRVERNKYNYEEEPQSIGEEERGRRR